jgi:hypothetical protein
MPTAPRTVRHVRVTESPLDPLSLLSVGAGRVLGGLFATVARARGGPVRALHPRGEVTTALLRRQPGATPSGVTWLDDPDDACVQVRLSRSVGLPARLPDILGLAVRVPVTAGRVGDVLLATTGTGSIGRFVLRPARDPHGAAYTTLLPYRTPSGPMVLAAFPVTSAPAVFELAWARWTGPWNAFATLEMEGPAGLDSAWPFDPVRNLLPGLEAYDWASRLREPSYAASRRARHAPMPDSIRTR